jgi:hypothetical protein
MAKSLILSGIQKCTLTHLDHFDGWRIIDYLRAASVCDVLKIDNDEKSSKKDSAKDSPKDSPKDTPKNPLHQDALTGTTTPQRKSESLKSERNDSDDGSEGSISSDMSDSQKGEYKVVFGDLVMRYLFKKYLQHSYSQMFMDLLGSPVIDLSLLAEHAVFLDWVQTEEVIKKQSGNLKFGDAEEYKGTFLEHHLRGSITKVVSFPVIRAKSNPEKKGRKSINKEEAENLYHLEENTVVSLQNQSYGGPSSNFTFKSSSSF